MAKEKPERTEPTEPSEPTRPKIKFRTDDPPFRKGDTSDAFDPRAAKRLVEQGKATYVDRELRPDR